MAPKDGGAEEGAVGGGGRSCGGSPDAAGEDERADEDGGADGAQSAGEDGEASGEEDSVDGVCGETGEAADALRVDSGEATSGAKDETAECAE